MAAGMVACYGPQQQYERPDPNAETVYPNPFSPVFPPPLEYEITESSFVTVVLLSLLGQPLDTVVAEVQAAGKHETHIRTDTIWDSGLYFYRVTYGDSVITKKIMMLK